LTIDGWRIEGFGVFHNSEVRGLSFGLTVFLGPNEAGKSTLLAFLRGVLFGFPNRRRRAPQHPPLRGGRHGGRVTLSGPQGQVTVERVAGRRNGLRVNGVEAGDQDLQPVLGGADEGLFCSVFAFGLGEMQSFEWLHAEQVRERIFSAGIAGAGASARQVMDSLEAEAAAIYRPRGASRVKELGEEIEQAQRRLKLAEADADRYFPLVEEQEKWSLRVAELSKREEDLRRRNRSVEALLDQWSELERAREELSTLEPVDEIRGDPEIQLAALTGRLEAARAVAMRLEEEKAAEERARAALLIRLDERLANYWDRVEIYHGRLALHRRALEGLEAAPRVPMLTAWIALGASLAFAGGWLAAAGKVATGLTALLGGLFIAAFLLYRRATSRAAVARLRREIAEWEDPVREWMASSKAGQSLVTEFLELRERCRKDQERRAKVVALDETGAGMKSRLESGRRDLAAAEEALRAFFRQVGAGGEAEFQSLLQAFRARKDLSNRIAVLEKKLPSGLPEDWRSEAAGLISEIAVLQAERDSAVGEQRLGQAALTQIAESAAAPACQAELTRLRSELAESVREWRIATLARQLVARTLREFTDTRQPAVIAEASSSFARITAGAYERILQDESGESLLVVDRDGQRKRPEELSRGTAEQLYLCLRLALASEFSRRAESLPLIMDDVLVNFDPVRARAVAQELARFSEQRQILIFTCHPMTAQLLTEVAPGAKVVQMERRAGSAPQ
jgi:uncharacterized protein YhaN